MSNNPIMDEVEMDHHHQALPRRGDVGMDSSEERAEPMPHARGFMGDLFDAQNNFIQAQHRFLSDSGDIHLLAGAQFQLIQVQYDVIRRLGCFE